MKKKKSQISKLADAHGVTERTVRNWKAAGAPLSNPDQLSMWLASRRQPPRAAVQATRAATVPAPVTSQAAEGEHKTGAAAALKRLEAQEVSDYDALQAAMRTGDELQIRLARDRWLRTSESLRKYDLAIEQARRDSGELVSRELTVQLCHELNRALYFALYSLYDACPSLAGLNSPEEVWKVLSRLRGVVHTAVLSFIGRPLKTPLPAWMVKAVRLGEFPLSTETEEPYVQFWFALREAMKEVAADAREAWAKEQTNLQNQKTNDTTET